MCWTLKGIQSEALTRGSIMFSMEVSSMVSCTLGNDGVWQFSLWENQLWIWPSEVQINLCQVEFRPFVLRMLTCVISFSLYLSLSVLVIYNPDRVKMQNISRDLQCKETVLLHEDKQILLTENDFWFQQNSKEKIQFIFIIPTKHMSNMESDTTHNVVYRTVNVGTVILFM